jgi:NADPH-dependent 2,4-dienoyl-CoA reductase/sulfur reductase-like enzyme
MSPEAVSTRPLLDKLGVKPGLRVAVVGLDDPAFMKLLRERTSAVVSGKPRGRCDIVFLGATDKRDLVRIKEAKGWIEPNGAIWVIRRKGARAAIKDTDLIEAGLAAGLVDNKIASFSDTQGAMRFVFRLRDRPK